MSRVGNFSSSEIYRLMSYGRGTKTLDNTGKAFDSYVKEKAFERKIGRPLSLKTNARPTTWGTLVEEQCFNVLDLKYSLVSKTRYKHEELSEYWTGMPDLITPELIGDIKCPYTMTGFMDLLDCMQSVEDLKRIKPQYYWQLVSNGILCNRENAVLVAYVPYFKDLEEIQELARAKYQKASNHEEIMYAKQFSWVHFVEDLNELPHLPNNCDISDVNLFEFVIPQEDKELLTERVKMAVNKLKQLI